MQSVPAYPHDREVARRVGEGPSVSGPPVGGTTLDCASIEEGEVVSPAGECFRRKSTRLSRRACDELLQNGAAVLLYWYGGGLCRWYEGEAAQAAWRELSTALSVAPSKSAGKKRDLQWTAGEWTSGDGSSLLLLTGHC